MALIHLRYNFGVSVSKLAVFLQCREKPCLHPLEKRYYALRLCLQPQFDRLFRICEF